MIYRNVEADNRPERVYIEYLPGGKKSVRMADNIEELWQEDAPTRKLYRFDEIVFALPEDSPQEIEDIESGFEKWWEYGMNAQLGLDTSGSLINGGAMSQAEIMNALKEMQKQNAILEECLLEISEVIYA